MNFLFFYKLIKEIININKNVAESDGAGEVYD